MTVRYYVDSEGNYIGAFNGLLPNIEGAVEVVTPPKSFNDTYINGVWVQAQPTQKELKLRGVEFEGVMCSATKEDMWGLNATKDWIIAGNSTNFEFDNGNVLTLTPTNYQAFMDVWVPFRASFF